MHRHLKPFATDISQMFFVLFVLGFLPSVLAQATAAQSLWDDPEWLNQRGCAKGCYSVPNGLDLIAGMFGCPGAPGRGQNKCFCRPDLTGSADTYLSKCVQTACNSNALDLGSAISIYHSYCSTAYPPSTQTFSESKPESSETSTVPKTTSTPAAPESTPSSGQPEETLVVTVTTVDTASNSQSLSSQPSTPSSRPTQTIYSTRTVPNSSGPAGPTQPGDSTSDPVTVIIIDEVSATNASPLGNRLSHSAQVGLGIGLGIPLGLALIIGILCVLASRKKSKKRREYPPPAYDDPPATLSV
ncbi:hypothetical protein TWF694_005791 [Orbilia ellipsospora]|uniref:Extracellular membrane protein CFEM domain-containing protein n=1 Tax=Orbilia ellipsospora TaxID=2528407 RepID=A0AAV9WU30_9PEZI